MSTLRNSAHYGRVCKKYQKEIEVKQVAQICGDCKLAIIIIITIELG